MDSLVECKLELEPPLERDMADSAVACTLARLAACERDLMACKAVSHSGSRAAALRYIGLARQMLEPAPNPSRGSRGSVRRPLSSCFNRTARASAAAR
jgi:hypothetical protein